MIYKYIIIISKALNIRRYYIDKKIKEVLNDSRGWKKHKYKFKYEPNINLADIIINISSNEEIIRECNFDGLSCANMSTNHIYINIDNWRNGCKKSKLSLQDYRTYIICHEIGHILGRDHKLSKNYKNKKASVMIQQTFGIGEALPNCWPLKDD